MHRVRHTAKQFFKLAIKKFDSNSVNPPKPEPVQPQRQIGQSKSSQLITSGSRTSLDRDLYANGSRSAGISRNGSSTTLDELQKRSIPVVDLEDFTSKDADVRDHFVQTLGNGLKDYGFVAVAGHNVSPKLLDKYYAALKDLFALPMKVKKKYVRPDHGRSRGYYELGQEYKASKQDGEKKIVDISEKWHTGAVANVFPSEDIGKVADFEVTAPELYNSMEKTSIKLVDAIGQYLDSQGLPDRGYLKSTIENEDGHPMGNHLLRSLHYPPVSAKQQEWFKPGEPVIRAREHEDLNLITLLPESVEPGLEIRPHKVGFRKWIPVHSQQGYLVCNSGKMLSLISGGKVNQNGDIVEQGLLPSIRHRVVGDSSTLDKSRYSTPFFATPHYDKPLRNLKTGEEVTTGEFLYHRLKGHGSLDPKMTYETFRKNADELLIKHKPD